MLNTKLNHLFWLCIANEASAAEREELLLLMADERNEDQVNELLDEAWKDYGYVNPVFGQEKSEEILNNVLNITNSDQSNVKYLSFTKTAWGRIAAAASILLILSAGLYFHAKTYQKPSLSSQSSRLKSNIVPGSDKAILVLANGSKIALDDVSNGEVAKQTGVKISKTKHGQLIYTVAQSGNTVLDGAHTYNTVETPRGGQYEIELADGTKVWLNSASSLHYPTAFTGSERKVELIGEAYFEVAKNKKLPFRVVSRNQIVEVMGTHFNINSYADETKTKTTLLQGLVKVTGTDTQNSAMLKPGQQSIIKHCSSDIQVEDVGVEDAVAWKNGYFMFPNEHIKTIMREISRWYDVDIEYSGDVSHKTIWGSVSKFKNVAEALKMLELTGCVHFKIEGRRIIVMP
ncbi:MAG: FecR protein [Mucilaginibacter sp.]|nr:FecR protein [Mucilaginibacter sp.]